jgi:hypothetical protein
MKEDKESKVVKVKKDVKEKANKLTKKQLALIELVYNFRFVNSKCIAAYFDQNYLSAANSQLNHLCQFGYLFKRHDSSYRLQNRPAEYCLMPKAIPMLRQSLDRPSERELKQVYARPSASLRFINISLTIFDIYFKLDNLYGKRISLVAKPNLNVDALDYLPDPLPEIFFTLDSKKDTERHYFVEYFDDDLSIGLHGRKISKYISYEESGDWNDTGFEFPTVVIVCQSNTMFRRAEKRVRYINRDADSDIQFRLISLDRLKKLSSTKEQAWLDPIERENGCLT